MTLRSFTPDLLPVVAPWFDDDEVKARLGGRDWIARELRLIDSQPGTRYRGRLVTDRAAWIAFRGPAPVAFVGAEIYDGEAAELTLVVEPARRGRGEGRRVLAAVLGQPLLCSLTRIQGHIAADNIAAIRCVKACGFTLDADDAFGDSHELAFVHQRASDETRRSTS